MRRLVPILLQMMILVHSVDGHPLGINAEQITWMGEPGATQNDKSKCMITFNNGKFVNTSETCNEVGILWQHEDAKVK